MQSGLKDRRFWWVAAAILALVTLPYLYAAMASGSDYVFGGFLLNPLDGNSYLAKMREGLGGDWTFTLPYTAEPGDGVYLFLFYIFLGHLSGWLGLPVLIVFHIVRLIAAVILLIALFQFCGAIFGEGQPRWVAFLLASFGSGLGWLAFAFVGRTSDLWVVEAYPFLSAYATPHFALGLALQLWLITPSERSPLSLLVATFLLAVISPFGVPVVLVAWGGMLLWELWRRETLKASFTRLFWITLGGAPVLLYDFWVATTHPVLSGWNAQNLTPSPPFWDLLLSFSPALLLAIVGAAYAWRSRRPDYMLLLNWAILCGLLLYLPFGLQRRFLSGFFVVIACLAALAIEQLSVEKAGRFKKLAIPLFALAIPSNLLVMATAFFGAAIHAPAIYMTAVEYRALAWMEENLTEGALVLAAPETGLLIPAYTDQRVVTGHPFETVDAAGQEAAVAAFFSGGMSAVQANEYLTQNGVDYIFFGPREEILGGIPEAGALVIAYQSGGVTIFLVGD